MSDVELGEIIQVLDGRRPKASFFHTYGDKGQETQTQIWVERLDSGNVSFRARETTRTLLPGEQEVLLVLLRHIVRMMSLSL